MEWFICFSKIPFLQKTNVTNLQRVSMRFVSNLAFLSLGELKIKNRVKGLRARVSSSGFYKLRIDSDY